MPRYIIERNVTPEALARLPELGRKSRQVLDEMDDVVWIRSFVSEAEGKIYCEYDAPSPEAVREHARRVGIPADRISEVSVEIDPEMFR